MADDASEIQKLNDLQKESLADATKARELNEELKRLGSERLKILKEHSSVSKELKGVLAQHLAQQEALNISLSDQLLIAQDYVDTLKEGTITGYEGQLIQEARLEQSRIELEIAKENLINKRKSGNLSQDQLNDLINKVKKEEDEYKNQKRLVAERKKAKDEIKKSIPLVSRLATASSDMLDDLQKGNADMAIKIMGEAAETVRESFKKVASDITGGFDFSLQGLLTRMLELGVALDDAQQTFRRATMLNEEFAQSLEDTAAAVAHVGINVADMSDSHMALITNVTDFTLTNTQMRDSLAQTAAVMARLGVANEDFAKGIQASMKIFGQSMGEAERTQRELLAVAQELQVLPSDMAKDFNNMSGSLAKLGTDGVGAFKELARVAKITGMEMEKILQITDKFDTFEGAAEQVGKINAALGGNFVNAMDLMMATDPSERFQTIRDAIMSTGLSFDNMSYYQRKFFAESLGLADVGDLALMMSGNMDSMQGATQKTAAEYEQMAQEAAALQTVQEQFNSTLAAFFMENKDAIMNFIENMRGLFETIVNNIDKVTLFVKTFLRLKVAMMTLSVLLPIVKGMIIAYASVSSAATASATANAAAQTGLAAAYQAAGRGGRIAIGSMVILAVVLAAIAAAMLIASPSKLVVAMFGLAAAVFFLGRMSEASTAQITALALPMLGLGAAIGLAAAGLGLMALGFSKLDAGEMAGVAVAIGAIATAIYYLIPALAGAGTISSTVSGPLMALGVAFLLIGAGVGIAAAGIGYMGEGMSKMFASIDATKITTFQGFLVTLTASVGALATAAGGLLMLSRGMASFGISLGLADHGKLRAVADFATGLAAIQTGALAELALMLERVAEAMESIPESKAVALTATMQAASIAANAAESLAGVRGAGGGAGGNNQRNAGQQRSRPFEVNFILDGDVFERKVIRVFEQEDGRFHAEAGRNER